MEGDLSGRLTTSIELSQTRLWVSSPERTVSQPAVTRWSENALVSSANQGKETKKGCLGILTWPQALALIFGLGFVIVALIVVPIVVVNTNDTPRNTMSTMTTTTTTSVTTTTTSVTTSTTTTSETTQTSTTTTTTTTSSCGVACSNVPVSSVSLLAGYNFDSNTNDITGTYPASGLTSPSYVSGYAGSAIHLDATFTQRLTTSPMDLSNKSLTIEFWFYLTRVATQQNAFFGQQSLSNVGDYCLVLMTDQDKLRMGFCDDDTTGSTLLQSNTWYHAAFVYDKDQRQQSIYLNGILDGQSATGVGPYLGTTGSMTIGSANIDGNIGKATFSGYLDQLMIYTRAKSACEVANDASLVAYFPFDGNLNDAGPNSFPITSSGAFFTTGRVNQGIYLTGSNSYLQIGNLINLGQSNYSYSIAFWAYPIVKGVLIHVSGNATGTDWCTPFITFDPSGYLITQVYDQANSIVLTGPPLITNGWTHITQTYSQTNGQRLYINGALYASSSASTMYSASGVPDYLTVGNMLSGTGCMNPSTVINVFQGSIDELRIYSREISSIGACVLAQV